MAEWYEEEPGGWDDPRATFGAAVQHWNTLQEENLRRKRQEELNAARAMVPIKRGVYSQGAPGAEELTRLPTHIPPELTARLRSERAREPAWLDSEGVMRGRFDDVGTTERIALPEGVTRLPRRKPLPPLPGGVAGPALPEGYPKPDQSAGWLYPSGQPKRRELPGGERLKEWERVSDRPAMGDIVGPRAKGEWGAKPEGYDAQMAANRKRYYARQENRKQLRIAAAAERAKGIRRGGAWRAVRESYNNVPSEGFRERIAYGRAQTGDRQSRAHADKLARKYGHNDWATWAAAGGPTQAQINEIRVAIPVEGAMEAVKRWHSDPVVRAQNREQADYKRQPIKAGIGEQRGFKMPTLTQITEMATNERPQGRWVPGRGFVGETKKDVFKRIHDRFDSRRRQLGVEVPGYGSKRKELRRLGDRWQEANLNAAFVRNVAGAKTRQNEAWETQIAAGDAAEEEVLSATPATPTPEVVEPEPVITPDSPEAIVDVRGKPTPVRSLRADLGPSIPDRTTPVTEGERGWMWQQAPQYSARAIGSLRGANREIRGLQSQLTEIQTGAVTASRYGAPGGGGPSRSASDRSVAAARQNVAIYTKITNSIQKEMDATAAKVGLSSIPTEAIKMSTEKGGAGPRIRKYLADARRRALKPLKDKVRTGTRKEKEAAKKAITSQVNRWKRNYIKAGVDYPESWLGSLLGFGE